MRGKTNSRKKLYNALMAAAIALIAFSGVMITGSIQGWFDKPATPAASTVGETSKDEVQISAVTVKDKIGGANIERNGVAYSLDDGTKLKDGDIIETLNKASVTVEFGGSQVFLNQNSEAAVKIGADGAISFSLNSGEIFAQISRRLELNLMDTSVEAEDAVFSASAPSGSARVSVYENSVTVSGKKIEAGKAANILSGEVEGAALSIESLNEFNIGHIREINAVKELCFTNRALDKVVADREAEIKAAREAKLNQEKKEQEIGKQQEINKGKIVVNEANSNDGSTGSSGGGNGSIGGSGSTGGNGSTGGSGSAGGNGSTGEGSPTGRPEDPDRLECTIEIRCDTILNNMGDLEAGKNSYVPSNGTILSVSTLEFEEGDTVFDVLKNACDLAGIQLEYSWTPAFDSYYIEGINNLYEFDCGSESGWMYKVNGWFPNYGVSAYTLEDGDTIVFCYTCKGLGADVGGGV